METRIVKKKTTTQLIYNLKLLQGDNYLKSVEWTIISYYHVFVVADREKVAKLAQLVCNVKSLCKQIKA